MKLQITKYLLLLAVGILIATTGFSQTKHEFLVSAGGGWSSLKYKTDFGNSVNELGGLFGVGYNYYFSTNWSLGTGAELSFYKSKMNAIQFSAIEKNLIDEYGDNFQYQSMVDNYSEKQNAMFVNIPLMVQYQTSGNNKFYLSVGAKLGIPVNGNYKGNNATFENTGYYPEYDNTLVSPKFRGFGTFTGMDVDKSIDFKMAVLVSAEAGIKWQLGNSKSIYTGVYVDYGLNDIVKDNRGQSFITYNNNSPQNFSNKSILASSYTDMDKSKTFTDKVIPVSFGLKVRFAFSLGKSERNEPDTAENLVDNSEAEAKAQAIKDAEAKRKAEKAERERIQQEAKHKAEENERARAAQTRVKQEQDDLEAAKRILKQPIVDYTVNGTELSDDKKKALDKKIEILKKYPNLKLTCEGHTCDLGSNFVNENIGLKRADAAQEYMLKNGIDESRIHSLSKGKSILVVKNDNEKNRRKNRRVEFIVEE